MSWSRGTRRGEVTRGPETRGVAADHVGGCSGRCSAYRVLLERRRPTPQDRRDGATHCPVLDRLFHLRGGRDVCHLWVVVSPLLAVRYIRETHRHRDRGA